MQAYFLRSLVFAMLACVALGVWAVGCKGSAGAARASEPGGKDDARADVRVMTFNIRYAGGDKGEHAWLRRRDAVAECIRAAEPDILGMQEVEAVQADWLCEQFPAYAFHGVGRVDGVRKGEFAPIMYRADRYELLESGHFWISTTPDVPGSKSWNTACERMASWVRLRDRDTKRPIVVINTHLDHVSEEAREHGVKMIRERAEQLSRASVSSEIGAASCPVIITGDFNTPADGPLGERLRLGESGPARDGSAREATKRDGDAVLLDAFRVANPTPADDEASFNDWKPQRAGKRIDWIFVSPTFEVLGSSIDRRTPGGVMASDHYPVVATLRTRARS